jgi:gas vesicle protein
MNTKNLLIGIASGLVAGAVIGILFAPYKGNVTRRKIKNQSEDYAESVKDKFHEFIEGVSGKFDTISKDISEYTDTIKGKIGDLRKAKKATMN